MAPVVSPYRNDRRTRYYVCNRTTNGATGQRCTAKRRSRQADPFEELLWEPIRATLSDPERLTAAALGHITAPQHDSATLEKEIRGHRRRLNAIRADRIRTFRDARTAGLTASETRELLDQLAEEADQIERQLSALDGRLQVTQDSPDRFHAAARLTEMAAAQLDSPALETKAELVALLDIQATPTPDGYLISGSIPLDPHTGAGKIRAIDPQDPCRHFAAVRFRLVPVR